MISNVYIYFLYGMTIMLFFNMSSMISFWIMMELNLVMFLLLVYFTSYFFFKGEDYKVGIYYFMIQSLGSLMFLLSLNTKDYSLFFGDMIFLTSIILKLGLFPFFFWVYKLGACSKPLVLFFILTLQKVPLFILLFYNSLDSFFYFAIFFSFFFGSFLILFSKSYIEIFISSSISSSYWVYMIFLDNFYLFLFYFLCYSLILFLFFSSFESSIFSLTSYSEFLMLTAIFMFLVGLPPMSLFFFKFYLSSFISNYLGMLEFFFFLIFSFLALIGYTNFFFSNLFLSSNLYLKNDFQISKMSYFCFHLLFFSFFMIW